jgi:hypothetical protein
MQQISPPLRFALIGIVLFGAIWFVALRPKSSSDEPKAVTAPGVQGLTNSVAKARSAKEAADASVARTEQAVANADGSSTDSATSASSSSRSRTSGSKASRASAVPTGAAARRDARRLVAALNDGKVVVLLFRNGSADSEHNANVVRTIDRRGGRVVRRVTSITQIGNYAVFTSKTTANQAPTTYVIGHKRRAKVIVGYTSVGEIDQAVGDVLGSGSGKDRYGNGRGVRR